MTKKYRRVFPCAQEFWILTGEILPEQQEVIRTLREGLVHSEPIRAELDRDLRVLPPARAKEEFSLPKEFFAVTAEELKREQQAKWVQGLFSDFCR